MGWHISAALMKDYENSLCSQEQAAESSAVTCLDGAQSAQLSENPTPQAYLCSDRMTAFSRLSRYGMTFATLTEDRGEDLLTWFLEGSHVRTLAQQEKGLELTESAQDCGEKWRESSVRYDLDSSSWRTHHCLFQEDLPWSSVILPKWGMTRNGAVYQHPTQERPIRGTESGLWQTPVADDSVNRAKGKWNSRGEPKLSAQVKHPEYWPTPRSCSAMAATLTDNGERFPSLETVMTRRHPETVGGQLNPTWVEWLMGWPLGWTDLKPLEMARFVEWQQQHSGF